MQQLNKIYQGDTIVELKKMPDECVSCIVTSPPYWGLRDYQVEGQIGLEPTLEEYLKKMLAVTAELKRVLRKDGVLWWNHGDCYGGSGSDSGKKINTERKGAAGIDTRPVGIQGLGSPPNSKFIPKCLCMQNYRLILRMIDDQGWILRNVCPWIKPNAMPSSVKDRLANKYEPVFLLVKSQKYFFDLDAIRNPHKEASKERLLRAISNKHKYANSKYGGGGGINKSRPNKNRKISVNTADLFDNPRKKYNREQNMRSSQYQYGEGDYLVTNLHPSGKNPGDVFTVPTQPFKESHFATFPEKLIEPMIMAGSPKEICKKCGKARIRITAPTEEYAKKLGKSWHDHKEDEKKGQRYQREIAGDPCSADYKTIGWTDCKCGAGFKPGVVLDPFGGVMTTAKVAKKLGRRWIMIELSSKYCKMGNNRLKRQGEFLDL